MISRFKKLSLYRKLPKIMIFLLRTCLYFNLLLKLTANFTNIYHPPEKFQYVTPLVRELFHQFPDFPLILHYDKKSPYTYKKTPTSELIIIFNYEVNIPHKRPVGNHFLHLIDCHKIYNDSNFLRIETKINRADMVMFVERELKIPSELLDKFFYARLVFLVKIKRRQTFYCAYLNSRRVCSPKQIQPGDPLPKIRPITAIMNYLDKEAVGYVITPPHVYYSSKDRSSADIRGVEISLLHVFSELFNFSYELIPFGNVTDDEGSYVEPLLSSIKKGNIKWGIGAIFENEKRAEEFDLSKSIFIEGYKAVFSATFERPKFWKFMYKNAMYHVTSISAGICTCLGAYFFLKFRSFRIYVRLVFLPLYDQNQPFGVIKSTPMRILFATWWLMCYVLIISYKIYLFGSVFKASFAINTLEDLVQEGFNFKATDIDYIYIESQCKKTPSEFCEKLLPRFTRADDTCADLRRMFEEKLAFIGEAYTLLYEVNKRCKLSLEEQSQLKGSKNLVFGIQLHVWPMDKNTILTTPLSKTVLLLEEAGLYSKWLDNETNYGKFETPGKGKLKKQKKLRVQDLSLAFYLIFIGYAVSIAAFLLEIYKQKKFKTQH